MPTLEATYASRPWLAHYGPIPHHLGPAEPTLYASVAAIIKRLPKAPAFDFLDHRGSYHELGEAIDRCAGALRVLGLGPGDRILIAAPTCPQGVIALYAANRLGAVAAMVHPLSTPDELVHYLDLTGAQHVLTLDALYPKFATLQPRLPLKVIILARINDYLRGLKRVGFALRYGRKIRRVPPDPRVLWWAGLLSEATPAKEAPSGTADDTAAILFSGGTTGRPKGILLSNRNIVTEGMMVTSWVGLGEGDRVLAILPIFHGFGLAACINATFMAGAEAIMVPTFTPRTVATLIRTKRPNMMAGVPTLFDALSHDPSLRGADLSCLRVTISGADRLPSPVKERFEALVAGGGGKVQLIEGYGLTETVTGVILTPLQESRPGSIGVPLPDMDAIICRPDTTEEVPVGEEGEICLAGPAVMQGYLGDPSTTAEALRVHADGRTWLHTGDLGRMDADGYFYFTCRLKRLIKSSGYNVYPAQVEEILLTHPAVAEAAVIGVPDPVQIERVVGIVVLKEPGAAGKEQERQLIAHCRERLVKWSCPRTIVFVSDLPKTRLGKIDYGALAKRSWVS